MAMTKPALDGAFMKYVGTRFEAEPRVSEVRQMR